jgi:Trk K+ transport system NAD-binding subunit
VIAILRREHILLPHPDTLIQINDRLMLITTPQAREPLARFLTPLPQMQEGGMQSPSPEAIV